jgi:hypothetical protein
MPVILRPTADKRVELPYQVVGGGLFVGLDDVSDFRQERLDILL